VSAGKKRGFYPQRDYLIIYPTQGVISTVGSRCETEAEKSLKDSSTTLGMTKESDGMTKGDGIGTFADGVDYNIYKWQFYF